MKDDTPQTVLRSIQAAWMAMWRRHQFELGDDFMIITTPDGRAFRIVVTEVSDTLRAPV